MVEMRVGECKAMHRQSGKRVGGRWAVCKYRAAEDSRECGTACVTSRMHRGTFSSRVYRDNRCC